MATAAGATDAASLPAEGVPRQSCIFCAIVAGTSPSYRIAETQHAVAFLDIAPMAPGHCLVVPKRHSVTLHETDEDAAADCGRLLTRVARAVGVANYNVLQNNGAGAGQEVAHVHFHVIPKPSPKQGLKFSGKATRPGPMALEEVRQQLAAAVAELTPRTSAAPAATGDDGAAIAACGTPRPC